jgi:TolB-like protein/tetratricopeptide (TPR) repeat protein
MRSVVIFPFQCSRADDEYLCNGFSVMLASTLAQMDDLKIVKSRTPFPADMTEPQVAEQFGVDGVIWGEVARIGGALVVNADLVDGRSGFLQFSNVYDTEEDTLLDTQELVANDVRTSIRGSQTPALRTAVRPASYDVLEMFWKADYEFAKRSPRSIIAAIGLFEQTIAMDPEYGPAYLKLAYATALLPDYVPRPRKEVYDRALRIAAQGVEKDPSMAVQHAAISGFVHHKREEWIASQEAFEAALMVDIDAFEVHHLYSRMLASVGRLDAALEQAQLARALDPHSGVLISRLAITLYWMNDVENAEALFELTHAQPEFVLPVNDLAYALLHLRKNDIDAATRVTEAALTNLERDASWVRPVFAGLQDRTKREDALQRVSALSESRDVPPNVLLSLWTLFEEYDRAMNVASLLKTQGETFEIEILFSEDFRQLREHPGFLPLLESIGITDYWASVGCRWENSAVACPETNRT